MKESHIRPWAWFAALWLGTLFLCWWTDRTVRGLYGTMFAFCGTFLAISILGGVVGGYHRNWLVTLLGTPTLVIALFLGDGLDGYLAGRRSMISMLPEAVEVMGMIVAAGPMLLVASLSHFLVASIKRRHPPGHCQTCGYDLTGNVSGICPECAEKILDARQVDEGLDNSESPDIRSEFESARRRRIRWAVSLAVLAVLGIAWVGKELRCCWRSGIALANLRMTLCEYIKSHGRMPDGWQALEEVGLIRKLESGNYTTTFNGNVFIYGDSVVAWSVRVDDLQLINRRLLLRKSTGRPAYIIRRRPGILIGDSAYTMKTNVVLYNVLAGASHRDRPVAE